MRMFWRKSSSNSNFWIAWTPMWMSTSWVRNRTAIEDRACLRLANSRVDGGLYQRAWKNPLL